MEHLMSLATPSLKGPMFDFVLKQLSIKYKLMHIKSC